MPYPRRVVWGMFVIGLCLATHICGGRDEARAQEDITVNCDAQETLTDALAQATPGTTILINGTCMERVTITTDRITLDGSGGAMLDGGGANAGPASQGVITIESARGVTLTGLTVQNGPDGILGRRGAAFTIANTIVQDNADEGIQIDENSTADLTDCTVQRNGDDGIVVTLAASALLSPGAVVTVNNNGDSGLVVSDASGVAASRTVDSVVTITANGNVDDGIAATVNAGMILVGTIVEANNNGSDGISIRLNSSATAESGAIISTNQNADDGIDVASGSHLSLFQNVAITSGANADEGIVVFGNANLTISNTSEGTSTCTVENNGDDGFRVTNSSQAFVGSTTTLIVQGSGASGIEVADGSHIDVL